MEPEYQLQKRGMIGKTIDAQGHEDRRSKRGRRRHLQRLLALAFALFALSGCALAQRRSRQAHGNTARTKFSISGIIDTSQYLHA
jgi:uncharacterized membrane protein